MADKKAVSSIIASLGVVGIGAFFAWAGSQGGVTAGSMPVFALVFCYIFAVQWLAFVPSYLGRTERYYDLTGSFTYISAIVIAVVLSKATDARSIMLLVLVLVWAGRLGPFLFRRVRRAGKDDRFDEIKRSFSRLLMTWTLQGLWVGLTLAAALALTGYFANQASAYTHILPMIAHLYRGETQEAVDRCTALLDSGKRLASAYNFRGLAYLKLDQPELAVQDFTDLVNGPGVKSTHYTWNRARAYHAAGQDALACADTAAALAAQSWRLSPDRQILA
mgnify:CR=1 FL=1